jgi:polyhydroxyalkanoic acid synthase PhaR subunit
MGEQQPTIEKKFDPFEPWRGMRDAYLDAWSKSMVEAVNSEAYSKATGAMLDAYLTASGPFKDTVEKSMVKALEQLSMPTRTDIIVMAERLTNIEMRLDDLDAKLDRMQGLVSKPLADVSTKLDRVAGLLSTPQEALTTRLERIESLVAKSREPESVNHPAAREQVKLKEQVKEKESK